MKEKIKKFLLRQKNVDFAYLFGSRADGSWSDKSDVDIAVYLEDNSFDNKLELHHNLEKTVKKEVDLVVLNDTKNLYLLESILKKGELLKESESRVFFEINAYHAIEDFKAFQRAVNAA